MKKYFFMALIAVFSFGIKAQAQSSLLATLNHDGEISIFYGATALQQAHAAADHGDVITLSSGNFASVDITKAVTIRGAGMTVDTLTHTEPTILANSFKINVTDTIAERLTLEGIYTNQTVTVSCLKGAMFLKCRLKKVTYSSSSSSIMKDLTFIHCRIAEDFDLSPGGSVSFLNSIVMRPYQYSNNSYMSFVNCYVDRVNMNNSEYKNCIIDNSGSGNYSSVSTSTYYNNLVLNHQTSLSDFSTTNTTNVEIHHDDTRVNYLTANYNDNMSYALTDALKALIKGTDGTEVGIYGGALPYDPTPSNPQITKFNVAAKTTADGKLSVDIEVSSAE